MKARSSTCIVGVLPSTFAMAFIVTQAKNFLYGGSSDCHPEMKFKPPCLFGTLAMVLAVAAMAALTSPVCARAQSVLVQGAEESSPDAAVRSTDSGTRLPGSASLPVRRWVRVPKVSGRLTARDLGLVINMADPYSVEVGEYYIRARKLAPEQVLRLRLPVSATLTPEEFKGLADEVALRFGAPVQALALAWVTPYAVNCNSITGALALGYDAGLCTRTCSPSRPSPYFNAATARPFSDAKMRPSMLLAARDATTAKAMIDRGVAADRINTV